MLCANYEGRTVPSSFIVRATTSRKSNSSFFVVCPVQQIVSDFRQIEGIRRLGIHVPAAFNLTTFCFATLLGFLKGYVDGVFLASYTIAKPFRHLELPIGSD